MDSMIIPYGTHLAFYYTIKNKYNIYKKQATQSAHKPLNISINNNNNNNNNSIEKPRKGVESIYIFSKAIQSPK